MPFLLKLFEGGIQSLVKDVVLPNINTSSL